MVEPHHILKIFDLEFELEVVSVGSVVSSALLDKAVTIYDLYETEPKLAIEYLKAIGLDVVSVTKDA